jgi:hypothetical protein
MLKDFKNLKGAQVLSKNEQKAVNGGDQWGDVPGGGEMSCGVNGYLVCGEQSNQWHEAHNVIRCYCVYCEDCNGGTM